METDTFADTIIYANRLNKNNLSMLTEERKSVYPNYPKYFLHGSGKKQAGWFWGGGGERAGRAIRASGSYREQGCQIAGVFMAASVTDNICRFVIPHPRTAAQHPPNIPQQRFSHLFSTAPKFCQVNMDVS